MRCPTRPYEKDKQVSLEYAKKSKTDFDFFLDYFIVFFHLFIFPFIQLLILSSFFENEIESPFTNLKPIFSTQSNHRSLILRLIYLFIHNLISKLFKSVSKIMRKLSTFDLFYFWHNECTYLVGLLFSYS